jgi:Carboxypeptidase regulatory-like domain
LNTDCVQILLIHNKHANSGRGLMSRFRAAVLSVATLCSASLTAQTPDTATLQGTITDPSHAVVSGAHITATNESTGLTRAVDSDSTGRFTLAGLPVAGDYTVSMQLFSCGFCHDSASVAECHGWMAKCTKLVGCGSKVALFGGSSER